MGRGAMDMLLRSSSLELSQTCKRSTRYTRSKSPMPTLHASTKVKKARTDLKYWAMENDIYARSVNHERIFPAEWLGSVLGDRVGPVGNEGPWSFLAGTSACGLRDRS